MIVQTRWEAIKSVSRTRCRNALGITLGILPSSLTAQQERRAPALVSNRGQIMEGAGWGLEKDTPLLVISARG